MKKEYILVIDSGVGGLSVLAEIYKAVPANYLYFADNKHCPYGSHTKREIIQFVTEIIDFVCAKYYIKIVVLACNTATTSAIKALRNKYPNINFVGTEPAIKLAKRLGYYNVLALTTPATAHQNKYKSLKKSLNLNITTLQMSTFASNIEQFLSKKTILNELRLKSDLYFIKNHAKNYDCIVLGCTHYVIVKPMIQSLIDIPIIDGNVGIAKQVKNLTINQKHQNIMPNVKIINSLQNSGFKQIYKKILGQILAK